MQRTRTLAAMLLAALLTGCTTNSAQPATTTTAFTAPSREAHIARIWRGRVLTARADEYERYLNDTGVSKFKTISNNLGAQTFRRQLDDGTTEFVVISYWPSLDAIHAYAGKDIERARDLPRDHEFLIDPNPAVRHYQIKAWEVGAEPKPL